MALKIDKVPVFSLRRSGLAFNGIGHFVSLG